MKKNIWSICFCIVLAIAGFLLMSAAPNVSGTSGQRFSGATGGSAFHSAAAGRFIGIRDGYTAVAPAVQEPPIDDEEEEDDDDDDDDFTCLFSTSLRDTPFSDKLDILREFRDRYLMPNRPGRWLVRCYYRLSPPLAAFVAKHESARAAARACTEGLIRLVNLHKHESL